MKDHNYGTSCVCDVSVSTFTFTCVSREEQKREIFAPLNIQKTRQPSAKVAQVWMKTLLYKLMPTLRKNESFKFKDLNILLFCDTCCFVTLAMTSLIWVVKCATLNLAVLLLIYINSRHSNKNIFLLNNGFTFASVVHLISSRHTLTKEMYYRRCRCESALICLIYSLNHPPQPIHIQNFNIHNPLVW